MLQWVDYSLTGENGILNMVIAWLLGSVLVAVIIVLLFLVMRRLAEWYYARAYRNTPVTTVKVHWSAMVNEVFLSTVWRNPAVLLLVNLGIMVIPFLIFFVFTHFTFGRSFAWKLETQFWVSLVPSVFVYIRAILMYGKTDYFKIFKGVSTNTGYLLEDSFLKVWFKSQNLFTRLIGPGIWLLAPWEKKIYEIDGKLYNLPYGKETVYNLADGQSVTLDATLSVQLSLTDAAVKQHIVYGKGATEAFLANLVGTFINLELEKTGDFEALRGRLANITREFSEWLETVKTIKSYNWELYGLKKPSLVVRDANISSVAQTLDDAAEAFLLLVDRIRAQFGNQISDVEVLKKVDLIMAAAGLTTRVSLGGSGGTHPLIELPTTLVK